MAPVAELYSKINNEKKNYVYYYSPHSPLLK